LENGLFSSKEFTGFAKTQTMFLHITSRVPGRKDDDLLQKIGGSGFPTMVVMNAAGDVLTKPNARSLAGFREAVSRAEQILKEIASNKQRDPIEADALEFLRRLSVGTLTDPMEARSRYIKCRSAMTPTQRLTSETGLTHIELYAAQSRAMYAKVGPERDKEILTIFACKAKLGGKWPWNPGLNRVLIVLMNWAESKRDPQLFASLLPDFIKVRKQFYSSFKSNDAFIEKQQQRLGALWKGEAPKPAKARQPRLVPRRRR
jgi:hypothetical protein